MAGGLASTLTREVSTAERDSEVSTVGSRNASHNGSLSKGMDVTEKDVGAVQITQVETHATDATAITSFEGRAGTGNLYNEKGELILLPAPTSDPRDPLNLPYWHKFVGLACVCFMGALAASAEIILGAMLPVFAIEYAGLDVSFLLFVTENHLIPPGLDPLLFLSSLQGAPPIWHTYLLGSLPLFVIGASNLVLVPLAISVGRRWVVIGSGIIAIIGAVWAGCSQSLWSHVAARCFQAIGAGTVESLIPFIIQDMCHYHKRNTAISAVFAAQGVIIIGLGIAAPTLIMKVSWRAVYFITAGACGAFIVGVFFFMPETRWHRTKDEMNGIRRPDDSIREYKPRTLRYNLAMMHGKCEWGKGWTAFLDTLRTFFYPHILFVTLLNSAMIGAAFAAAFTTTPVLLAPPYNWNFFNLGLCLIAVLIAAGFVAVLTGNCADFLANLFAKKRGRRLPENQLINLILPSISAIVGSLVFGLAGDNPFKYSWPVFLLSLGLLAFGFLGTSTVGAVYVLECYPALAGPALVNIASFRFMVAFALSFKIAEWIVHFGYLNSMAIYTGVMSFFVLLIPVVFVFGPAWRKRWPGPDR